MEPTAYPELNEFLAEFVESVRPILGDTFVGAYLVGSFALRDGDMSSDCDFLVVTTQSPDADQEAALRRLHADIPTRSGYWAVNFEGSYAPQADLASLDLLDREWLYVDRGSREMQWSTHCNVEDTRWVLRERGITLVGPPPATFACEVSGDVLRQHMRTLIPGFLDDLATWASFDLIWTQRYVVETVSRMLYTLATGEVESKRRSLEWGRENLASEWRALIEAALADRMVEWNLPSDSDRVAASIAFAEHAAELAVPGATRWAAQLRGRVAISEQ